MSDEILRELVSRMATDPAFAAQVRSDPQGTAAAYGLAREQVDQLNGLVAAEAGPGPSMLDARLSKSSLFFGGGLDLDTHSLAGGVSAAPGPSDYGIVDSGNGGNAIIIDTGFTDTAQQAGIQDDTIHSATVAFTDPAQQAGIQDDTIRSAGITSKGMVSLLPTADDAAAHADPLGMLCDGFLEPATFVDNSGQDAGITGTGLAGSDKSFEDLGLREGITDTSLAGADKSFDDLSLQEKGITDTSLAGADKSFDDLSLQKKGITDTSLAGSDKSFEDLGLREGPEVTTLSVDQTAKG